ARGIVPVPRIDSRVVALDIAHGLDGERTGAVIAGIDAETAASDGGVGASGDGEVGAGGRAESTVPGRDAAGPRPGPGADDIAIDIDRQRPATEVSGVDAVTASGDIAARARGHDKIGAGWRAAGSV